MNFLGFARTVGNLKRTKRSGWVRIGINNPESIADHVFRTSMLALVFGNELGGDINKLVKMALVHDLAESLVGDIVVDRGGKTVGSPAEKHQKEAQAIKRILKGLPQQDKLILLWEEYEHQQTIEARILKQLDKLEMAVQALEYESGVNHNKLDEFWESARKYIQHPDIKRWFVEIEGKRSKISK